MAIDRNLENYLRDNKSAAAQYAGSWIGSTAIAPYTWLAEPAKGLVNGGLAVVKLDGVARPAFDRLDELASQVSNGVSEIGINYIGEERLTGISETISNAIAPFLAKISEFLNTSRHQLGAAMLNATDAAGAMTLQRGIAANLEQAVASDTKGELPPASVVADAVRKGLRDTTQSVGGLMKSVKTDAANALSKLVGKDSVSDAAVIAHETAAKIHGTLFADSAAWYVGKHGDTPETRQAALVFAEKAAQRVTGLSVSEAQTTDAAQIATFMQRGDGLAGFLAARTAEVAAGKPISNDSKITLAPDAPVTPDQTPAVAARDEEKKRG